jgi:Putative zinc-finger
MCEYSGRLVAWLDQELPPEEAVDVEGHVGQCAECRLAVGAYRQVSAAFLPCYEASMARAPRSTRRHWMVAIVGAAAAILLAMLLWPQPAQRIQLSAPAAVHAPAMAFLRSPRTAVAVRVKHVRAPQQVWIAQEPSVRIALPADALFPPGAVPEGFSFIADVRTEP